MAHQLEISNGKAAMAYAASGGVPWHGLGVSVPDDLSPEQFMKKAGLDWTVEKIPTYYTHNNNQKKFSRCALIRSTDGRELSNVSADWEPVQNLEAFEFFNEFVQEGNMKMHTAGSLRNGEMVWALAKIDESFTLFGGDQVDSHLLFSNPHMYGCTVDVRFTPIRVVCNNTLTLSLSSKTDQAVRLDHRKKFNPEMVKRTLGIAKSKLGDYKTMAEFLGSKRYTPENIIGYFREVFDVSETKEMTKPAVLALELLETQPGAKYAPGTWWSAANAVTFYADHLAGKTTSNRLSSAWYGVNRTKKIKALELAVKYAEVS